MTDPASHAKARTGLVVVASTRAAAGDYEDRSGPVAVDFLRSKGLVVPKPLVVADADIETTIDEIFARPEGARPVVLLTSGGTGITADDRTVEAVDKHLTRPLPGVVQAFFTRGMESVPTAVLSRAVAGVAGSTFAMTLPGSRGGVKDGCAVLDELLDHILNLLEGHSDH